VNRRQRQTPISAFRFQNFCLDFSHKENFIVEKIPARG
jgi:hypothetical protein